ncbi:MAG: nuclear transport factor 2 family protein [Candidatus Acidiferrales bacterium]
MRRLPLYLTISMASLAFAASELPATNTAIDVADATVSSAPAASYSSAKEAEVRKLLSDFVAAMSKNDVSVLDKIWADDFTFVSHDGEILTKAQLLDLLKSGTEKFESVALEDISIRTYGSTAVVTARATQKATLEGKDHSGTSIVSIVLVKNKGRWRMVLAQLAELKPAAKTDEPHKQL